MRARLQTYFGACVMSAVSTCWPNGSVRSFTCVISWNAAQMTSRRRSIDAGVWPNVLRIHLAKSNCREGVQNEIGAIEFLMCSRYCLASPHARSASDELRIVVACPSR